MVPATDRLNSGLSEIRNVILGAQILFGFQYEVLFQPGFERLPGWARTGELTAFLLLALTLALLIAPTPFHRISEAGEATGAICRLIDRVLKAALACFGLAMGVNVALATRGSFGDAASVCTGVAAALAAFAMWFALEFKMRPPRDPVQSRDRDPGDDQSLPLKEKISQILTESRIVLPGVQALLGFQFAAHFTDAFDKLEPTSRAAHEAGLLLLLTAMVLLMAPAPFHRIAERAEPTPRMEHVGARLVLWALVPLGLAIACDLYVAVQKVSGSGAAAAGAAGAVIAAAILLWLALPLAGRLARTRRRGGAVADRG